MAYDNTHLQDKHIAVKKAFPTILEKNMGLITKACKAAKIDYKTYQKWYEYDKEFRDDCLQVVETVGDFVESKLYKTIQDENPQTIMFYCRTRLKGRGYAETKEEETPIWKQKEMEEVSKAIQKGMDLAMKKNKRDY